MDKPYYTDIVGDYLNSNHKILTFPAGRFYDIPNKLKCIELTKEEVLILKLTKIEVCIIEHQEFKWVFVTEFYWDLF